MPCYCFFRYCHNKDKDKKFSFHRFPVNPILRKQWIFNTGEDEKFLTRNSRLCSAHFKDSCFQVTENKKKLKKGACPTIFFTSSIPKDKESNIDIADQSNLPQDPLKLSITDFNVSSQSNKTSSPYQRLQIDSSSLPSISPAPASNVSYEPNITASLVLQDHNYSPRKCECGFFEHKIKCRKKLKIAGQTIRRLKSKIATLSGIIQDFKNDKKLT